MTDRSLCRGRVVGPEATADPHHPDLVANLKPPHHCFALARAAQNALMTDEIVRMIGTAMAREKAGRAIDNGAKLAEPPRFQRRVRQFPDPHREIESVTDDIDWPVGDFEIGLDP